MKIIAHRGASGDFPENSLLAFEQAIYQKADAIELDIHFHQASGQFIVLHDQYLDNTTKIQGKYDQYPLSVLTRLSLGQNQQLVTLEQALAKIAGRTLVNIEMKSFSCDKDVIKIELEQLKLVLESMICSHHFSITQFVLSSFNHTIVFLAKAIIPHIKTAALIAHCPFDHAAFSTSLKCDFINPSIECINESLVKDAHQKGLKVWVYTVDRIEDIKRCLTLNVDGIFTNFPETTRKWIVNYVK